MESGKFHYWLSTLRGDELLYETKIRNLTQCNSNEKLREQLLKNPNGVPKLPRRAFLRQLAEVPTLMIKLQHHPDAQPIPPQISKSKFWCYNNPTLELEIASTPAFAELSSHNMDIVHEDENLNHHVDTASGFDGTLEIASTPAFAQLSSHNMQIVHEDENLDHHIDTASGFEESENEDVERDASLLGSASATASNQILKTGLYASVLNNLTAMQRDGCKDALLVFDFAKFRDSSLSTNAVIVLDICLQYMEIRIIKRWRRIE